MTTGLLKRRRIMRRKLLLGTLMLISGLSSSWAEGPEEPWKLEEVVVTATKTPHLLKDVPVETVVITQKEIENSSTQTVSDILRYVPGIFVRDENVPGITSWKATMRGLRFDDGYALILIDGERVRGEGMGDSGIGLNQIPPQMIEKIEIVKGPSSALYGSDAIAGVVNIITKRVPDKTTYGFEAGYGSHHTNMEYMYWGTKVNEKLGILLQVGREESKMGAYGYRDTRDESFKRSTFIGKIAYDINENVQFDLKLSVQEEDRKTIYLTQDTQVFKNDYKYRIAPKITTTFDDDSVLIVHGYYYDWHLDGDSYGTDPYPYAIYRGDMYYKDIEVRYTKPLGETHLLTIGSEYLQQELDYTFSQKTLHSISGYIQDEANFDIGIPLTVVLGARTEHHSQYGSEFCLKVNIMLKPFKGTKIRASVGRGFKSPTIRQAFYTEPYPHSDYYYVSNPNLKAETSWGYSLGIEQNIGKRFLGSIALFRNDIENMITRYYDYKDIDGDGIDEKIRTFANTDKALTQGIETTLQLAVVKTSQAELLLNTGYTYMHTENKITGEPLDDIPRHNLTTQMTFDYKPLGILFNVGVQHASKTEETGSYSVVDVKFIKKIGNHSSVSIEGNNIFDSDYGGDPDSYWGSTWFVRYSMNF
jgi:outer membrane receptor for ferrienterochelin and colicins